MARAENQETNYEIRKAQGGVFVKELPDGPTFYKPDREDAQWFLQPEPGSGGEADIVGDKELDKYLSSLVQTASESLS